MNDHTIVAIATASGQGGIGVVRLSGPDALAIGHRMIRKSSCELPVRQAVYVEWVDQQLNIIDQGIALYFKGPESFTGEDVVEFQAHGSMAVLNSLVETALGHGAVLAGPGEFSQRAFLNGKMDLVQAEAVADLIASQSKAQAQAALRTLKGVFSEKVYKISQHLVEIRVQVEAWIDFIDEDIGSISIRSVSEAICRVLSELEQLLDQAQVGVRLQQGVSVALIGVPNVGKSSLLNRLLGYDRAIVSEEKGTTRDTLTETRLIEGVAFSFVDTAGVRQTVNAIEQQGIERSYQSLMESDLALVLCDGSQPVSMILDQLTHQISNLPLEKTVLILNKQDLLVNQSEIDDKQRLLQNELDKAGMHALPWLFISALHGQSIEQLEALLLQKIHANSLSSCDFSARQRHVEALSYAHDSLIQAQSQLGEGSWDLMAEDIRCAHQYLAEIVGTFTADDLLGKIFSTFCVGK